VSVVEPGRADRVPRRAALLSRLTARVRHLLSTSRRRVRWPVLQWGRPADAGLATCMLGLTVFVEDAPGDAVAIRALGDVPPVVLLVFAVASAALFWRRRAPLVVLAVAVIGWAALLGSGYADLGPVTIVALYSAGRHATDDRWGPIGVAAAIAVVNLDGLTDPAPWGEAAFGGVVMFAAWYVGRRLRFRAERAAQLRRDQAAEATRIVAEERTRIARELHDVVAHRVSVMTVLAGAAKTVAAADPQRAVQAIGEVEEAGRQALDELRHLLGVLRPRPDSDDLGPQPGFSDVPKVVDEVRRAGLDVSYSVGDLPPGIPARVELFSYRIIQEALTNTLKHAGPAQVWVSVRYDDEDVEVSIENDGSSDGAAEPDGPGLVGMRERVALCGGELQSGPRPGGGFQISARLPVAGGAV